MVDCTGCTECCNWMTFIVRLDEHREANIAFYRTRDCVVTEAGPDTVAIAIPSTCPYVTEEGCSIYDKRPKLCESYDCRRDPFLPKGKYK